MLVFEPGANSDTSLLFCSRPNPGFELSDRAAGSVEVAILFETPWLAAIVSQCYDTPELVDWENALARCFATYGPAALETIWRTRGREGLKPIIAGTAP